MGCDVCVESAEMVKVYRGANPGGGVRCRAAEPSGEDVRGEEGGRVVWR